MGRLWIKEDEDEDEDEVITLDNDELRRCSDDTSLSTSSVYMQKRVLR